MDTSMNTSNKETEQSIATLIFMDVSYAKIADITSLRRFKKLWRFVAKSETTIQTRSYVPAVPLETILAIKKNSKRIFPF